MMPNRQTVHISALYGEQEDEIPGATCGDQVRIRIRGVEEEDILPGFVLCSPKRPVHCVSTFEAQVVLLDIKSILTAGFNCVLHVHAAQEEVTVTALLHKLEKGTGRKSKKAPGFATKGMSIIARLQITGTAGAICVERFEDYPQLGRFTLRYATNQSMCTVHTNSEQRPRSDHRHWKDHKAYHRHPRGRSSLSLRSTPLKPGIALALDISSGRQDAMSVGRNVVYRRSVSDDKNLMKLCYL
jgi:sulfate adenylyltransferase subunit 1 (EFTu-like GTPase family)